MTRQHHGVLRFPTIIASITDRLLVLPKDTVVLTGHGDSTTIGAEAPHRPGGDGPGGG